MLDISSLYAAPLISANLGDFGATVIKVEHPRGDDARRWGLSKDGVPLWWKTISRNKRVIELDLNSEDGRDVVRAPRGRLRRADRELPARPARAAGASAPTSCTRSTRAS